MSAGPFHLIQPNGLQCRDVSFGYTTVWNAFKKMSTGYSPEERAALFHDTAVSTYRIQKA